MSGQKFSDAKQALNSGSFLTFSFRSVNVSMAVLKKRCMLVCHQFKDTVLICYCDIDEGPILWQINAEIQLTATGLHSFLPL